MFLKPEIEFLYYFFSNLETGLFKAENLNIIHSGIFNSSEYSDLNHITFKIENLKEDTAYFLRVSNILIIKLSY